MTQPSRTSHFLSGVLGGLAVLLVGAVLIATDVIDTGDETRQVVEQSPIERPGRGGADGLTVNRIYRSDGPGVVFIRARGGQQERSPFGLPQPEEGVASGSGFVIDREGYILTNAHVVQASRDVTVAFEQGETIDAEVKGTDLDTDLAVLKIDPKDAKRLRPLELGDSSKVKVGDPTVAIGNPFGLDRTVTTGIVSALQRQIPSLNARFSISDVIQTDASINPGNSGGPLIDASGKVIGVNSQIVTGGGNGSVGIGFAVPINTAKTVIPQLRQDGKVERAFLGVTTAPVNSQVADDLNLPRDEGALIQEIEDGGPADDAGLRGGRTQVGEDQLVAGGDLIVKVDGTDISRPDDVAAAIADNKPGDEVTVEYFRGDDRKSVRVKLGKRPRAVAPPAESPGGGLQIP